MPSIAIDFKIPADWSELTDKQLLFVYRLIAEGCDTDTLKTLCLLHWGGVKVVGRQHSGNYLLKKADTLFEAAPLQLAELLPHLNWLAAVPTTPVRRSRIKRHKAVAADFQGVPFETYIIADNLYQGYLQTQDDTLLDQLAAVLYTGLDLKHSTLNTAHRMSIFYWLASLKDFLSRRFSHFLQSVSTENANLLGGTPNYAALLQESMDAQIRALTKGDPTKEAEILALDTWRALTELNAQAREYSELKAQMKQ